MMTVLNHKIDFSVLFTVSHANPNGDPLNGNRPRQDYNGYGEVSDVCLKRKLRNRFQDMGESIVVQSMDRTTDGFDSIKSRVEGNRALTALVKDKTKTMDDFQAVACASWIDVRSFGQIFTMKGSRWASIGIRGPVTIQAAISVAPIDVASEQITKSANSKQEKDGGRGSDTMGMKHSVPFALYRFNGSISVQLAEKTGFTDEDAARLKKALCTLFVNDESSSRPAGSMDVRRVYWWEQPTKVGHYSPAKVFRSLTVTPKVSGPQSFDDFELELSDLDQVSVDVFEND